MKCILPVRRFESSVMVAMLLVLLVQSSLYAAPIQETKKDPSQLGSLTKVPQSAGFYYATMNHEALLDAVFESNAWKSIKASAVSKGMKKAYRRGKTKGYADYNEENPFAQYLQFYGDYLDNFFVNSAWEVGKQVVENEVFIYVDNDAAEVMKAMRKAQLKISQNVISELESMDDELTDEQSLELGKLVMQQFADVGCPTMLMGTRLKDPEEFKGLLELTRAAAETGLDELPPDAEVIKKAWKVIDEKGKYLLTMQLELEKLPWNEILAEIDDAELLTIVEDFLFDKKMTVALGIVDNLLIFGVASDVDVLANFGKGEKLIDLPELVRLENAISNNEAITSVYYYSDEYSTEQFTFSKTIEGYIPIFEKLIAEDESFDEANREHLAKHVPNDIREFIKDIESMFPKPGLAFGFTKLGDEGIHGYSFRRSTHPMLDGSKPLELVERVSSDTVAFMIQRPKDLDRQYGIFSKWSWKIYDYMMPSATEQVLEAAIREEKRKHPDFDDDLYYNDPDAAFEEIELTQEQLEKVEEDQQRIKMGIKAFETWFTRFDKTTKEKFLPAIKGKEAGFFVDLVTGPNPWLKGMEATSKPVPVLLPAMIFKHNDKAGLVAAMDEYRQGLADVYEAAEKARPDDAFAESIDFSLPEKVETEAGTIFETNWLKNAGLVPEVEFHSLITDDTLAMGFYSSQTQSLTKDRNSNLFGPVITKEPSFNLMFFDNRVMMRGVDAWFDVALETAEEQSGFESDLSKYEAERDTLQFTEEQLKDHWNRFWTMGKCWKGFSLRSYPDNGGTSNEYLLKFKDIKADE